MSTRLPTRRAGSFFVAMRLSTVRTHNDSSAAASRLDTSKGARSDSHPHLVLRGEGFVCLSMPRFCLTCSAVLGSHFHDCFSSFLSLAGGFGKLFTEGLPEGFLRSGAFKRREKVSTGRDFLAERLGLACSLAASMYEH